jgi:hypothetical protein
MARQAIISTKHYWRAAKARPLLCVQSQRQTCAASQSAPLTPHIFWFRRAHTTKRRQFVHRELPLASPRRRCRARAGGLRPSATAERAPPLITPACPPPRGAGALTTGLLNARPGGNARTALAGREGGRGSLAVPRPAASAATSPARAQRWPACLPAQDSGCAMHVQTVEVQARRPAPRERLARGCEAKASVGGGCGPGRVVTRGGASVCPPVPHRALHVAAPPPALEETSRSRAPIPAPRATAGGGRHDRHLATPHVLPSARCSFCWPNTHRIIATCCDSRLLSIVGENPPPPANGLPRARYGREAGSLLPRPRFGRCAGRPHAGAVQHARAQRRLFRWRRHCAWRGGCLRASDRRGSRPHWWW